MVTVEAPATQRATPTAATGDGSRMLKIGLPIGFCFCMDDKELLLHYIHREDLASPFLSTSPSLPDALAAEMAGDTRRTGQQRWEQAGD
ncbi:hypothetical protein GUJ93_ZPchr0004g38510 [Zizania palustris]|uniref:NAC domain-containing protein n=1 Tax=Zizania palustris TaxID=103762 RepID=A0A8J5VZ79_ZIZPA|nr:hypothetical protein GUJ93_ZPchr0004g38510 [Zizania palustris]